MQHRMMWAESQSYSKVY